MNKGTCFLTYIPLRSEPGSGAEMVTSLIFGESYDILETRDGWHRIRTAFDSYEGWIHNNAFSEYESFYVINDALYVEASAKHQKIFIPCGGAMPESGSFYIGEERFTIEKKLKTNHHLPMPLRLVKTAQTFLNTPYLWGGRTFMGIDCSGYMQVVYKACGLDLPRDTSQQIYVGHDVAFSDIKACDLVFFRNYGGEKVSHVGMMMDKKQIIHASGKVKINDLSKEGLYIDGQLAYEILAIKRMI
jgi:hypothetical protein